MDTSLQDKTCCRTWKPLTAGILTVIAGVINLILGIQAVASSAVNWLGYYPGFESWMGPTIQSMLNAVGVVFIIFGIVSIAGGVLAIMRKVWGLGLAGAILALFPSGVLGILAIIFVSLGKAEFVRRAPAQAV